MSATEMIAQKIRQAEPSMDVTDVDRKLLEIACQDWTNYVKFNANQGLETSVQSILDEKIDQVLEEKVAEMEAVLTVWVGMWLKKWRQRVKLLIGNQTQQSTAGVQSETSVDVEAFWSKLKCKQEMIDMVVSALIRNAEICGTEIIATNLIKKEMQKTKDLDVNSSEQGLFILNNVLRKAREIAHNFGPCIYIKVNKCYYDQMKA
jgi:hypothetical protein